MTIKILIANPDAVYINDENGMWIISALNDEVIKCHIEANKTKDDQQLLNELIDICEEALLIRVRIADNIVKHVFVFKSITSKYELNYFKKDDRTIIFSDHFKNALSQIDARDRNVGTKEIAAHFLFPSMPGIVTPVSNIKRISNGALLICTSEGIEEKIIQVVPSVEKDLTPEDAVSLIDCRLEQLIEMLKKRPKTINLLSGGVDSTLIQTYLGIDIPSLSTAFDSPEFNNEIEYAKMASRLLNTQHNLIVISEENYLKYLESAIVNLGQPVAVNQIPLLEIAFGHSKLEGYNTYISGDTVGFFFGTGNLIELPLGLDESGFDLFDKNLFDYSRNWLVNSDFDISCSIFGNRIVDSLLTERLDYIYKRIDLNSMTQKEKYLELYAMCKMLHDNNQSLWRHLAYAYNKSEYTPFLAKSLLDIMSRVPLEIRFELNGINKYILKTILRKQLPTYPVNSKKQGTGLPRTRYCKIGPLKDFFKLNEIPDFIDPRDHDLVLKPSWDTSWFTFNSITYAIWRDKVLKNPEIELIKSTKVFEWEIK